MTLTTSTPSVIPGADAELARHLAAAGVPPRFLDRRLDTFLAREGTRRALEVAHSVADRPRGLLLIGPSGTGKTHLAVGILAERTRRWLERYPAPYSYETGEVAIRPALSIAFAGVPKLLDDLRYAMRRDEEDPLPRYAGVGLLVLDDLGRERTTDWALERLYVLVNERYEKQLPTIATTNYRVADLAAAGLDALVSRLAEQSEVVQLDARDYRMGGR